MVPGRWQPSGGDGSGSSSGWLPGTSSRSEPAGTGTQESSGINSKQDQLSSLLQHHQHHHHHHHHANNQKSQQQPTPNSLNSLNTDQLSMMHQKMQTNLQNLQQQQQQQQQASIKNDQLNLMLQSCAKKNLDGMSILHPYQQHQLDPNNQKPKCPECGKIYSNNSNLKQHIVNVHTVQTAYISCHVCSKQFKTKQYLQIHLLSMHGIRKRKSYPVYQMQPSISQGSTPQPSPQHPFVAGTSERWSEEKP